MDFELQLDLSIWFHFRFYAGLKDVMHWQEYHIMVPSKSQSFSWVWSPFFNTPEQCLHWYVCNGFRPEKSALLIMLIGSVWTLPTSEWVNTLKSNCTIWSLLIVGVCTLFNQWNQNILCVSDTMIILSQTMQNYECVKIQCLLSLSVVSIGKHLMERYRSISSRQLNSVSLRKNSNRSINYALDEFHTSIAH